VKVDALGILLGAIFVWIGSGSFFVGAGMFIIGYSILEVLEHVVKKLDSMRFAAGDTK